MIRCSIKNNYENWLSYAISEAAYFFAKNKIYTTATICILTDYKTRIKICTAIRLHYVFFDITICIQVIYMSAKTKKESKLHSFINKHFMIIVVIAITLIPSIYTVLFLGSMWDPYGNTGSLPVAIVNQDEPIVYNGKNINIGEQLCENLKTNKSLQFNFVDEDVALNGLENGTYYMVMVVPKNFSANSVTLTTDNPQKMELSYYTNPGTNYIASKFGESAIKTIKENLNKTVINTYAATLYSKLNTIKDGFYEASDGSDQIYNGVGTLRRGNFQITNGLSTLSAGCLTLKEGTGTLKDGLSSYTDGVNQIDAGVKQIKDGTVQLGDGAAQIKDGTKTLTENNDALNDGSKQLLNGLNLMNDTLSKSLTQENLDDLQTLEEGLLTLNDGIHTLQKAINEDYKIDDSKIEEIKKAINEVDTLIKSDQFKTICDIINYDAIDWDRVIQTIEKLDRFIVNEKDKAVLNQLKEFAVKMKDVQDFGKKISPESAEKIIAGANSLLGAYSKLSDGVQQLYDGGNMALPVASQTLKTLTNGLIEIQNGLTKTKAKDGETGLIEGMTTLSSGIKAYTSGVTQVDGGVDQLSSGIKTLHSGSEKLYAGTQKLVSNNNKLNSGASQLNNGAVQLVDGSQQLYDGTLKIDDGCEKLSVGAKTLRDSLLDGANQIEQTNTDDSAVDMFSQPVVDKETFQRNINSNGEAMSAYMMCAGLWVACLAFCLMFSPFKTSLQKRKTFVSHGFIAIFVSAVQAAIMVTLIMAIDGMRPAYVPKLYLMAVVASLAFMSIVYLLNTLFDTIGSFILLIFLCLQLSGAAGTYPIELSPKFYQIIHPFMPFTYAVDAFKSSISTGNSIAKDLLVLLSIAVVCVMLTCITYEIRKIKLARKRQHEIETQTDEELEYYNNIQTI